MTAPHSPVRTLRVLFALTLVVLATLAPSALVTGRALAAPAALTAHSVTITVSDVTPSTPVPTVRPAALQIAFSLHNTTGRTLKPVVVTVERSDPITSPSALDAALARPRPPTPSLVSPVRTAPLNVGALVGNGTIDEVYRTSTSSVAGAGIGLYAEAIYPLYLVATYTDPATGEAMTVGTTQTYIPSFPTRAVPAPLKVTWIWPLLERPHRFSSDRYFTDDELATEFATGGRLDRALTVAERVAGSVELTLLVDPDLLDEAEVMAAGYRVYDAKARGGSVPGTGSTAAKLWLDRFRTLVTTHPDLDVQLTPYADPDVESLTRNGLTWNSSTVGSSGSSDPQLVRDRLDDALGDRVVSSTLAWPAGGTLSAPTLAELVRRGVQTVVLNDTTLPRGRTSTTLNALAPVQTVGGPALAAVLSSTLQTWVARVLARGGLGVGDLPALVAELAVRSQIDKSSTYVVLTPTRVVDVDPDVATRTILATADSPWAQSMTLTDATGAVTARDHGDLHPNNARVSIPPTAIEDLRSVQQSLPQLTGADGLLAPRPNRTSTAVATVQRLPVSLQRTASSELLDDPDTVISSAQRLAATVDRLRAGVRLVQPRGNGSYTLTSTDAPLPVTVTNTLDVPVRIAVHVAAAGNLPGFEPRSMDVTLPANSTQQLRVPTRIDLTGRIRVEVTLSTRDGLALGDGPLELSVRNTALGTVGVAITTIAAIVLGLALLARAVRAVRWRQRRRRQGPQPPVTDPLAP